MKKIAFILFTFLFFYHSGFSQSLFSNDCEMREQYSDWVPVDSLKTCTHEWVYAEWKDVNQALNWTNAVYCPCGCGGSSNEARVCEKCKLNQSRVRSYWYVNVPKKSEYEKIIESITEKQ